MKFTIAAVGVIAAASCASAFVVPTTPVGGLTQTARSTVTRVNAGGKYDGKLWDDAAKNDVKSLYNADEPRSETNFDPFEKDGTGNKCDASGWYPGESRYKDPIRPNVSFAEYLKQKAEKEAAEGSA